MIGSQALTTALLTALPLVGPPAGVAAPGDRAPGDGGLASPLQGDQEHVDVTLLADTAGVAPGQRFRLGVLLRIDPRWHVYWINAGEGGFPTSARITGPAGFEIGAVRFPAPHRFTMPGDIVAYGFESELLLIADVQAPAELTPGAPLAFGVKAGWLECADVCIPGDAEAALELVALAPDGAAREDNARLFARWAARLPRPWSELEGARATWSGDESDPRLRIETPGVEPLELFPYENARTALTGQTARGSELALTYHFRTTESPDPKAAAGVLRVKRPDGDEAFYEVDVAWSPAREVGSGR